jgi:pimeloyl-ACP methyl ester carboxylesterase
MHSRTKARRPRLSRIAIASAAALIVVGCSSGGGAASSNRNLTPGKDASYQAAACPTPNAPGFPQLDLGPEFTCGYLTVPENRAHLNGRRIKVAVARLKAVSSSPKPDPIVWLEGGPGGTGLLKAPSIAKLGLNADRDIIFLDQRGTFHADPLLACPEIDAFLHRAAGLVSSDPATIAASTAATRACRTRLAGSGIELSSYDTSENANDVADLRVVLGIAQWNVYGISYGSDLALQLLRDHPQGIRSLVLDGLVPPQSNLIEGFWPNAAAGYRALFDACAAQTSCHDAFPNLAADFASAVKTLNDAPKTVSVPDPVSKQPTTVVIDAYKLANLIVVDALRPGGFDTAPAIVHAAAAGDVAPAATALVATLPASGGTGYGLAFGVFCRESVAFTTPARTEKIAHRALANFPGSVLALVPQLPYVFDDCGTWNVGKAPTSTQAPAISNLPVLLMSGSLDGVAPPSNAVIAASHLSNAASVIFPGAGHDTILWSSCAPPAMTGFLDQPSSTYRATCETNATTFVTTLSS